MSSPCSDDAWGLVLGPVLDGLPHNPIFKAIRHSIRPPTDALEQPWFERTLKIHADASASTKDYKLQLRPPVPLNFSVAAAREPGGELALKNQIMARRAYALSFAAAAAELHEWAREAASAARTAAKALDRRSSARTARVAAGTRRLLSTRKAVAALADGSRPWDAAVREATRVLMDGLEHSPVAGAGVQCAGALRAMGDPGSERRCMLHSAVLQSTLDDVQVACAGEAVQEATEAAEARLDAIGPLCTEAVAQAVGFSRAAAKVTLADDLAVSLFIAAAKARPTQREARPPPPGRASTLHASHMRDLVSSSSGVSGAADLAIPARTDEDRSKTLPASPRPGVGLVAAAEARAAHTSPTTPLQTTPASRPPIHRNTQQHSSRTASVSTVGGTVGGIQSTGSMSRGGSGVGSSLNAAGSRVHTGSLHGEARWRGADSVDDELPGPTDSAGFSSVVPHSPARPSEEPMRSAASHGRRRRSSGGSFLRFFKGGNSQRAIDQTEAETDAMRAADARRTGSFEGLHSSRRGRLSMNGAGSPVENRNLAIPVFGPSRKALPCVDAWPMTLRVRRAVATLVDALEAAAQAVAVLEIATKENANWQMTVIGTTLTATVAHLRGDFRPDDNPTAPGSALDSAATRRLHRASSFLLSASHSVVDPTGSGPGLAASPSPPAPIESKRSGEGRSPATASAREIRGPLSKSPTSPAAPAEPRRSRHAVHSPGGPIAGPRHPLLRRPSVFAAAETVDLMEPPKPRAPRSGAEGKHSSSSSKETKRTEQRGRRGEFKVGGDSSDSDSDVVDAVQLSPAPLPPGRTAPRRLLRLQSPPRLPPSRLEWEEELAAFSPRLPVPALLRCAGLSGAVAVFEGRAAMLAVAGTSTVCRTAERPIGHGAFHAVLVLTAARGIALHRVACPDPSVAHAHDYYNQHSRRQRRRRKTSASSHSAASAASARSTASTARSAASSARSASTDDSADTDHPHALCAAVAALPVRHLASRLRLPASSRGSNTSVNSIGSEEGQAHPLGSVRAARSAIARAATRVLAIDVQVPETRPVSAVSWADWSANDSTGGGVESQSSGLSEHGLLASARDSLGVDSTSGRADVTRAEVASAGGRDRVRDRRRRQRPGSEGGWGDGAVMLTGGSYGDGDANYDVDDDDDGLAQPLATESTGHLIPADGAPHVVTLNPSVGGNDRCVSGPMHDTAGSGQPPRTNPVGQPSGQSDASVVSVRGVGVDARSTSSPRPWSATSGQSSVDPTALVVLDPLLLDATPDAYVDCSSAVMHDWVAGPEARPSVSLDVDADILAIRRHRDMTVDGLGREDRPPALSPRESPKPIATRRGLRSTRIAVQSVPVLSSAVPASVAVFPSPNADTPSICDTLGAFGLTVVPQEFSTDGHIFIGPQASFCRGRSAKRSSASYHAAEGKTEGEKTKVRRHAVWFQTNPADTLRMQHLLEAWCEEQ